MSTPFACAWDAALVSGLTLNPITIAFDAEASMTSLSLIAPTELWMTFSLTSSVDSRSSASASASTEPCTSALRMSRSSFTSPDWICFWSPSSVIRVAVLPLSLSRSWRMVATCRAFRSSDTATRTSPAAGTPLSPRISTGSDGPALLTFFPLGSLNARIRPEWAPTTTASPSFNVPAWISTVATGPRPRSSRLSMITPRAARFGLALSSRISDWSAVISRSWSMPVPFFATSAKKGTGIDQLLEMTALQSEILELKANPNRAARGVIIESRLDRGRGPVATVLIQNGTLKEGDAVVVGAHSGRIRALSDPSGKKVKSAGPSDPVEIQGLGGVPAAGDVLVAVSDERKARQVATMRQDRDKLKGKTATRITLEGLQKQIQSGEVKELRLILKADVQGSVEALAEALERLSTEEVKLKVIHSSVGAINESDVMLASASNAIVIGFNVKPETKEASQAQANGVDIRSYNVIYDAINDLRAALAGMLAPGIRETTLGRAQVRQIFVISKLGPVCGSYVTEGKIVRNAKVRVRRGDEVVGEGTVGSLKRFKDDVREVLAGLECGIGVDGVSGIQLGDILEAYTVEEVARTL